MKRVWRGGGGRCGECKFVLLTFLRFGGKVFGGDELSCEIYRSCGERFGRFGEEGFKK